jgi:hypothetical protein
MTLKTLLRLLILGEALLGIGGASLDAFFPEYMPQALQDYEATRIEEPWNITDTLLGLIAVIGITSWFGLWFTKTWARIAYSVWTLGYYGVAPFTSPSVYSAAGGALDEISIMCSGGILVLIWFTDLKNLFSLSFADKEAS